MGKQNYIQGVLVALADGKAFRGQQLSGGGIWGAVENDYDDGQRVTLRLQGYGEDAARAFDGLEKYTRIAFKGQLVKGRDWRKADGSTQPGGFEVQLSEFSILGKADYERKELPTAQAVAANGAG